MNKTAMMQLRDRLQAKESSCTNYDAIQVYKSLINLINTELLEIEKQQHLDTYNQGYRDGELDAVNPKTTNKDIAEFNDAINYFNQTFNPK